jgi:cytochrome c556
MIKPTLGSAVLAIALTGGLVLAQDGGSHGVAETISARRGLMNQLASLQVLIDARLAASEYAPELYDLGQATAASLEAFAVLLPPETNLQGGAPAVDGAETTAAPAIWEDLPAFQQMLREAATQARMASEASDIAAFSLEWLKLAEACSSCHETYVVFDPFAAVN